MNYREHFTQIRDFLKPYQRIWQNEIMLMYPDPFSGYPMEWIEELRSFQKIDEVIRLEKKEVTGLVKSPTLLAFYQQIAELSVLPKASSYPPIPEEPWTWLYMIPKKQHEIRNLAPYLNHLYQTHKIEKIIDIGGGIGLLAQVLNNQYQLKVTTVDMNTEFQKTGFERHEKYAKDPSNKVHFKNMKVEAEGEFSQLHNSRAMPVGLHTCGKLALDSIKVGSQMKVPVLVNFGCCYLTLHKAPGLQNISQFAQSNDPLWMNQFALTLSCRAHKKMDEKDLDLKIKVKFFRYAIHILLHDHYGMNGIVSLGNSHPKLYERPFGEYVLEQFKRISLEPKHTQEELNAFFDNPELKLMIERMLAAGMIRNALGRVLEMYLLFDRAIYLEEQGYDVSVQEFFDEEVSPRNIGITGVRTYGEN